MWDAETGELKLEPIDVMAGPPYAVSFLDEYEAVLVGGRDMILRAWSTRDGAELMSSKQHKNVIYNIAVSPEERRFATASFDTTVCVWQLAPPERGLRVTRVWQLKRRRKSLVNGVAFSPGGKQLVSCDNDGKIIVRTRNDDGYSVAERIDAHDLQAWCIEISPDGRFAATGSSDNTIAVWCTSDWSLVRRLEGHDSAVWSVAFDADTKHLVSSSLDNTIRIWDLEPWEEIARVPAGAAKDPGLTCEGLRIGSAPNGLSHIQEVVLRDLGAVD